MADPKVSVVVEVNDTQAVDKLGKLLRNLQQAADAVGKSMTAATTASQKYDAAMTKAALSNEKLAQAAAKTALANQRVATEAERTAAAQARAEAATARMTATTMRAETAQLRAATAHQRAETAAQRQADAQQRLEQKTASVKQAVDAFANTLRNVTLVAGVLGTTFKQAFDFAKEGAAITQTAAAFDHFATNIVGIPNLLQQLKDGADGTITEFELMSNTLTLVAGTTQETGALLASAAPQLLEIARAAQVLNPALGDVTYFYESLNTGIKRLERRWLDNLGLVVKAQDAYAAYAQQLDKSTLALTAEEKTQAFLNETLRVGQLLIDQVGGSVESAVDPYSRLEVQVAELTNSLKQLMASGLLPYVQLLTGGFQAANQTAIQIGNEAVLSLEELAVAYEETQKRIRLSTIQVGLPSVGIGAEAHLDTPFIDGPEEVKNLEMIKRELALTANSFEEFVAAVGGSVQDGDLQSFYENATKGIGEIATQADRSKPALYALTGSLLQLQYQSTSTEEELQKQAEALAKLRESQGDAAISIVQNTGNLNEFQSGLLKSADTANLTSAEIFKFAESMGILSEEEAKAAQNMYIFEQQNTKMLAGVAAGTLSQENYEQAVAALAQRLGVDLTGASQQAGQELENLNETVRDNTIAALEAAGELTDYGKALLDTADETDLLGAQTIELARASGILTDEQIAAARASIQFKAAQAALIAQAQAGYITWEVAGQRLRTLARILGIELVAGANAASKALGTVGQEAAGAFFNALDAANEAMSSDGGGGAIATAVDAQQEWNAAFAQSFMQLLDAKEPIENWNTELLKSAAAAGASAETLALLAAATGEYSEEQISNALKGAAMKQAIEEISAALVDGRATTDEALAAVAGFQEQLAQGGDLKLDLQAYGIEPLQEAIAGAGGGAGSAAEQTTNWIAELGKLASQGDITAGDVVALAMATGEYDEVAIRAALKTLLMTEKMKQLAEEIGKRPIQDIIEDFKNFESQLATELAFNLDLTDIDTAIVSANTLTDTLLAIPEEISTHISITSDPLPALPSYPGGQQQPQRDQHGGPLAGTTLVGEVRPEMVIGGQVIPRIPPGFFMDQDGFAESVAAAMAGSMVAPPSYNNTTNITRTTTTNNNQRSIIINNATGASASQSTRRELGAF